MKVDYINPILTAASTIINVLIQEEITLGKLSLLDNHELDNSIAIIMWMTGDFEGRFLFAIKKKTALRIAGIMLGEELEALRAMARSALAELATMILGRMSIIFSERGIQLKITPPMLVMGESVFISSLNQINKSIINIPLLLNQEDVIDVRIESSEMTSET